MSLVYLLSKFSREAMVVEIFLISVLGLTLFGFYLFKRRRYGVAKNHVPDQVVKALLVEILSLTEGYKNQLFGVGSLPAGTGVNASAIAGAAAKAAAALGAGSPLMAGAAGGGDDAALKAQMGAIAAKNEELSKALQGLNAEKQALEEKLKNAPAAGAAPGGGGDDAALAELKAKIANLEARLAEYEVIEDDLANLKRYQQENKQLKAQIDMLKGGAPAAAAAPAPEAAAPAAAPAPAPAAAPEPAASPIAAAEAAAPAAPAPDFADLAGKVDESIAAAPAPAGGSVTDPAAVAAATTAAASSDTAGAAAQKPAAGEAPKSDSDLLSEFEKMLSS